MAINGNNITEIIKFMGDSLNDPFQNVFEKAEILRILAAYEKVIEFGDCYRILLTPLFLNLSLLLSRASSCFVTNPSSVENFATPSPIYASFLLKLTADYLQIMALFLP